ncbi:MULTISPECIES: hypothetical protein [unclassified Maridesulfovibrio]|uniref:hypothetical protein n=1 Tax=unclassified Maridesulfovibrio TaxID=2794999 RepID=UPI003B40E758
MKSNLSLYEAFISEKGGDPLRITNFVSPNSNRVVVDMVLIQQALALGGLKNPLEFYAMPNPARAEAEVKVGRAVILGFETWSINFDDSMYMSDEIIGPGEFVKVVVGRADNERLMHVRTLNGLRKFSAITGHRWPIDQKTLMNMGISKIMPVARYNLQIAMLQKQRADFGLMEYPNAKNDLPEDLAVVPGIVVGLDGSRHFMVSKSHRDGYWVFKALNKGLAQLKEQGVFRKAYIECGFISPKLDSWKKLNPEQ